MVYEGKYYVQIEGTQHSQIAPSSVQKLLKKFRDADFLHWEQKTYTCLDLPEVTIALTLDGKQKQITEGCDEPGKLLKLAAEIDKVSGSKQWVGKSR